MANSNFIYGEGEALVPAHLNFGLYMLRRLLKRDTEIAMVDAATGKKITYQKLTQYSVNLAAGLIELGVKRGDTVALGSEKRIEIIPTVLAITFTGATCLPLDVRDGQDVLIHKITIVRPSYLIYSEMFWKTHETSMSTLNCLKKVLTLDNAPDLAVPVKSIMSSKVDARSFEIPQVFGQTDVAYITFSSGTTGMPKAVMLTHLNSIIRSSTDWFNDESLPTVWIESDWFHSYDLYKTCVFFALGGKVVFSSNNSMYLQNEMLLQILQDHEINILTTFPSIVIFLSKTELIKNYTLLSIKYICSAGAPLEEACVSKVFKRLPNLKRVFREYGMTEVGYISIEDMSRNASKSSGGAIQSGSTVKILNPSTGEILGPNQSGEIRFRGEGLMKGYIGIDPATYLDDQGFIKTGDIGYYNDDRRLYITDRIKDVIMFDVFKVSPMELESVILKHPDVIEVGVAGKPDSDLGELPAAFVVRRPGSTITEQQLVDYVAEKVSFYMLLRGGVKFVDKLPKNVRGKLLRDNLKDMFS